jgi:hypothetical protein
VDDPFVYGHLAPQNTRNTFPPAEDARTALTVQKLLRVNLGWLSARAERWLREAGGDIPANYETPQQRPVVRVLESEAGTIGVVLFPEGVEPGKGPGPQGEQAVLEAGRSLKSKVGLVLGVSPWGYTGERDFIPKAAGVFDVILGGGEGIGFDLSLRENPTVLWLRPDSQGRAVNVLELLEVPANGKPMRWKENDTFRANLEFLDDTCPSDPAMQAVVDKATKNH